MAKTENRYIRIEDWKGNVYYPESSSKSSTAGSITDSTSASKEATGTNPKTDGEKVSDSSANGGSALIVTSSTERLTLFSTYLANVPFGKVSVGMRMKSSIATGTTNLVEVNTYFVDASGDEMVETKLDTASISGDMFGTANEYINLGMVTNFKGTSTGSTFLRVEIIVLPDTGATIYFDQLAVAMEMRSTGNVDIHVEERSLIINTD